ncbi:hypothetical protein J6590_034299 [Homalodisca vitripennis]|nr:hypothetical protein J6590_034299 [Homalodisca vitripennis]
MLQLSLNLTSTEKGVSQLFGVDLWRYFQVVPESDINRERSFSAEFLSCLVLTCGGILKLSLNLTSTEKGVSQLFGVDLKEFLSCLVLTCGGILKLSLNLTSTEIGVSQLFGVDLMFVVRESDINEGFSAVGVDLEVFSSCPESDINRERVSQLFGVDLKEFLSCLVLTCGGILKLSLNLTSTEKGVSQLFGVDLKEFLSCLVLTCGGILKLSLNLTSTEIGVSQLFGVDLWWYSQVVPESDINRERSIFKLSLNLTSTEKGVSQLFGVDLWRYSQVVPESDINREGVSQLFGVDLWRYSQVVPESDINRERSFSAVWC